MDEFSLSQIVIRHRKFMHDWSKVIVICEDLSEARETVVQIMNTLHEVAEVSVYSQYTGTTTCYSPRYEDGNRVPLTLEEVK